MNIIACNPADTNIRYMTIETAASEDLYSTTPMIMMHSLYRQPNEEELHSSFEEAISDRVCAFNKQRKYLSVSMFEDVPVQYAIHSIIKQEIKRIRFAFLRSVSRQLMLRLAIALMLILVGFDLMGLLILLKP